jgi:phage-related protein
MRVMIPDPTLVVRFYRTEAGIEPVRRWVLDLTDDDCRSVGIALNEIQFPWPVGMPRVRKLQPRLWEARIIVKDGIARVFSSVDRIYMVLLHGFIKKSQKTPDYDLETAIKRLKKYEKENQP